MLTFYLLLAALGTALDFVLYRYAIMLPDDILRIISMIFWALILIVAVIVIPHYFIHAKVIVTNSEIASAGGFITNRNDYMTVNSVKSVSVIITPLGTLTGFNFVVINALGAKMLLCFLRKQDVILISKHINDMIRRRDASDR
jgi:hypothetical protein